MSVWPRCPSYRGVHCTVTELSLRQTPLGTALSVVLEWCSSYNYSKLRGVKKGRKQLWVSVWPSSPFNKGVLERVDYNGKIDWNVFLSTAAGPTQCYSCLENDSATCSAIQQVQTCATDPASLGTTHCGFGAGIYRDALGNTSYGVMRGWINCAGNIKEARLAIEMIVKIRI